MLVVKWPQDVLARANIPAQSKAFLASAGLPEFLGVPWMEFGVYDSGSDLVIGQSSDDVIVVIRKCGLVEAENSEGHVIYMNRDVETLSAFIAVIESDIALGEIRIRMTQLDPEAMSSKDHCFWPQVLDYEDALHWESAESDPHD